MKIKIIITVVIFLLITFSTYNLMGLLQDHQKQLKYISVIRFQYLFILHLAYSISCLVVPTLKSCEDILVFLFFQCLLTFICLFFTEAQLKEPETKQLIIQETFTITQTNPLQKIYLQVYKNVYIGSLAGLILLGLILGITQIRNCKETRQFNLRQYINKSIEQIEYNNKCDEQMCAICLVSFKEKEVILKIKSCSHIFHEQCLNSWMKIKKSCPMDRAIITKNDVEVRQ